MSEDYSRESIRGRRVTRSSRLLLSVTLIEIRLFPCSMESKLTSPERQEALWLRSIAFGQTVFGAGMSGS